MDRDDVLKLAKEAGHPMPEADAAFFERFIELLASKQARQEPKLTPCRHCGFRVALNEPPVPESEPVSGTVGELPPLPEPEHDFITRPGFTAAQMQDYARAALQPAQTAPLTLNARQLKQALALAAPDWDTDEDQRETEVTLQYLPARTSVEGTPMDAGLYLLWTDYPEEGCVLLDEKFDVAPSQDGEVATLRKELTDCRVKHEVACSTLELVKEQRSIAQKALAGQCARTKELESQLSTARREAFEQCKQMAKDRFAVPHEMWQSQEVIEALDSLQCPEQPAAQQPSKELLVTSILLDVVPGDDGEGVEVYAKSVDDVVTRLTSLSNEIEELKAQQPSETAIHNAAIKAAANVCDAKFEAREKSGHPREASTARALASEIRSLLRPAAQEAEKPSAPTDISKRLRQYGVSGDVSDGALLIQAADEIERYYGGMLAWKATAEAKDREAAREQPAAPSEDKPVEGGE